MNRKLFYDHVRGSLFGGSLSAEQVRGMDELLDAGSRYRVSSAHHMANILAQVYRETGGYMLGIKETVMPYHKDKNPSDAEVIRRLDKAWAKGQLKGVKKPYWRNGEFGRGPIQLSVGNYKKFAKLLGIPLDTNKELALDPKIGAEIAVKGMVEGHFRYSGGKGLSLSRYKFPEDLDNPPRFNPRRIVNGNDGSDAEVAANHRKFHSALVAAGWDGMPGVVEPTEPAQPAPTPTPAPETGRWGWVGRILRALFGRRK